MISNFYPIVFPMESFQIERLPYVEEKLAELRANYNDQNSFFGRDGYIYISPMGDRKPPNGQQVTLNIIQDRDVVGSLLRHIFFRTFRDKYESIIPLDFYPFRILSEKNRYDLLVAAFKDLSIDRSVLGNRLGYRKLIEVQFRDIIHDSIPMLGAVIEVRYSWTYGKSVSCASLHSEGFNLIGRDVLLVEPLPGLKGVLAPDETLIGSLSAISNGRATVETNEGKMTYPLSQLIPQRNRRNIDDILSHFLGDKNVERLRKKVKEKDSSRLSAKAYQAEVARMADVMSSMEYRNKDNFTFSISAKPYKPNASFRLENPVFRFDYGPGASSKNPSYGLLNHGPYDSLNFAPKTPRVAIFCHGSSRNAFTSFLGKLRDGISTASNFPGGMRGKYRLNDLAFDANTDFVEIQKYTGDEYERVVAKYLSQNDGDRRAHLALIQTKEGFKSLSPSKNPYYRAKARLMMAGIPTQFLKTETIRQADKSLKFTIDSVALQIYAKMGGIPYVLPAGNNVDREIIVGIGNAVTRSNLYSGNEQDRVVGITTFFKADGEYLFGTPCREVPYSEYFETLLASLRTSLQDIASGYGWRNGDAVRLVFHVFKPIKDLETEVIAKLVQEYPQYAITFAFVTITNRHPFIIFDEKNRDGISVRGKKIGAFVPKRKINWILDEHSCLIQLSGLEQMRTAYHGFSSPALIRIHERSTYRDLHAGV